MPAKFKPQRPLASAVKKTEKKGVKEKTQLSQGAVSYFTDARQRFSDDLDMLFDAALNEGNYTAALKAKELAGKVRGFLTPVKNDTVFNIDEISDAQLMDLINKLQAAALAIV